MKCPNCGTDFQGNFCPVCGNNATVQAPQPAKPKKKPIYKRWWFYFLSTIVVLIVVLSVSCSVSTKKQETIDWSTLRLAGLLPDAPSPRGRVSQNADDRLSLTLFKVTESKYNDYLDACIAKGFSVDAEKQSFDSSYRAYNADGYHLSLWLRSSDELDIELEAPMALGTIEWPTSELGAQLPAPDSETGKFSYEREDKFFVYVGNMSRDDYGDYVSLCADYGFTVDYDKGDTYYRAANAEGYKLSVEYVGFNIISIELTAPEKSAATEAPETEKTETESTDGGDPTEPENTGELRADFKEAMDSYEKFMDSYVAFMKKYNANPTDLSLIAKYASMLNEYNEMVEKMEAWKSEDLSDAELAYYFEVQTRVNQKLADIA